MITVQFSGDLITPDGSDTDGYGEPCEPGSGSTYASGWWAPRWTRFEVSDDPAYADTFTMPEDEEDPAVWICDTVGEYMNWSAVEWDGGETIYAADAIEDYRTGRSIRPAAHVTGATPAQLEAAFGERS